VDKIPYGATCVFDNYTKIYRGVMGMSYSDADERAYDRTKEYSYLDKVKEKMTPTSTQLVIKDMNEREYFGYNKYGKYLTVDTDENMLQHLYEELLDGAVYIRTLIEQRKKK
jgi:hypothetical protein